MSDKLKEQTKRLNENEMFKENMNQKHYFT